MVIAIWTDTVIAGWVDMVIAGWVDLAITGWGVMSLALCPQVVSQTPQHFRSSEMQTTCDGCFFPQSICSVISLHSKKKTDQTTCEQSCRSTHLLSW